MADPLSPSPAAIELALPFTGRWLVRNSPARRVPSHGSDLFGERYAIDFVGVDHLDRPAPFRDWRTAFTTEPPERFVGFGRPILAPCAGTVVTAHDGEPDHAARRSQLALVLYMAGQAGRVRQGVAAVAGNHVLIRPDGTDVVVALVHLRQGSLRVKAGQHIGTGEHLADCGSSGNSTQPHLHLQVSDGPDLRVADGVPMVFARFREWRPRHASLAQLRVGAVPTEGAVVEAATPSQRGLTL